MTKVLTYENSEGFTVFTSQYHRNRGKCCNTQCLHCPFGFTVKKSGFTFKVLDEDDNDFIQELNERNNFLGEDYFQTSSENKVIVLLKGVKCGFFIKNHIQIKHLFLGEHFLEQGLSKELIEAYYF